MVVIAEEVVSSCVFHSSGRIVHRTCQHSKIGYCNIISRLVVQRTIAHPGFPLRVFQAFDSLKIEDIRVCTLYASGFESMVVEQQMMASRTFCYLVCRGNHLLVVTVEEIDLESLYSHVGISLHHCIGEAYVVLRITANEITPTRPQYDTHSPALSVGNEFLEVDIGIETFGERLVSAPSLVDDDVFKFIICSKVNIIFICGRIHARLEIHSCDITVIPPVPCHLSWFYP